LAYEKIGLSALGRSHQKGTSSSEGAPLSGSERLRRARLDLPQALRGARGGARMVPMARRRPALAITKELERLEHDLEFALF